MQVLIAPDSFGGTLTAADAAGALAEGWSQARPGDDLRLLPLADGGEGLLDVLAHRGAWVRVDAEVVGPLGLPVAAALLLDGATAVIESAQACGLALVDEGRRDPELTTTWGVGDLLEVARAGGAREVLVGLGGSATVDGGVGALTALGFRPRVADGSGLKIGGGELARLAAVDATWVHESWSRIRVRTLADVATPLLDAPSVFGPQKGASPAAVQRLEKGLRTWDEVARRDLDAGDLADRPMTGAAGGLGYGLAAGLGASIEPGGAAVADLLGLDDALGSVDLVVTGEGALDATSFEGKVVGTVTERARRRGLPVVAVVGRGADDRLDDVEEAAPRGPGDDPAADLRAAARRLASRPGPRQSCWRR